MYSCSRYNLEGYGDSGAYSVLKDYDRRPLERIIMETNNQKESIKVQIINGSKDLSG